MAEGVQQRHKSKERVDKEQFVLEQEIIRLRKVRNTLLEDEHTLEKEVFKDLEKSYRRQNHYLNAQKNLQQKMADLQKEEEAALPADKARFSVQYKANRENYERMQDVIELERLRNQVVFSRLEALKAEEELQRTGVYNILNYAGKFGKIFNITAKHLQSITKVLPKISASAKIGLSMVAAYMEMLVDKWREVDKAMAEFRMQMGMTRLDSKKLTDYAILLASTLQHVGVDMKVALEATRILAEEFGGALQITQKMVETTAILKAQLGVSEDVSGGFLRNMAAVAGSTADAQVDIAYFAKSMASAAGFPLNLVMQDVAKMSATAYTMVSKMPLQIIKTAVAARQLGTTLNKMAEASSRILNFTENVQAEMEASVLVGRSINLQLARQLAYQGKIEDSTREIMKEAKRIDFMKLDRFQMEAFANAAGRSADEIAKMLQTERQLEAARRDPALQEQYNTLMALRKANEATVVSESDRVKQLLLQEANQERLVTLQNKWNQLLMHAIPIIYPIIDGALRIAGAFVSLLTLAGPFGSALYKIGKTVLKIGAFFGKWVPIIGWVITGIELIYQLWSNFDLKSPFFGLDKVIYNVLLKPFVDAYNWIMGKFGPGSASELMVSVIKGIVGGAAAMFDALTSPWRRLVAWVVEKNPFKEVLNWILSWFGAGSASKVMLSVIKGIVGGAAAMFDALTSPWRRFMAWVAEKIPFFGKSIAEKLRGGMVGGLKGAGILEQIVPRPEAPATISTQTTSAGVGTVTAAVRESEIPKEENNAKALGDILAGIKTLNDNLLAGKIAVYMDGNLLSTYIARGQAHLGGYGVNTVRT